MGKMIPASPLHYSKAPIVEAVLDLRVTPAIPLPSLEAICSQFQESYPNRENIYFLAGEFAFDAKTQATSTVGSQRHVGYKLSSEDARQIVQFRSDGFAYSVRAPYGTWEEFVAEAQRLWAVYASQGVTQIVRAAVRYINRLAVPKPTDADSSIQLSRYLQTVPQVSPAYPQQTLASFFCQLQMSQTDLDAMLILNIAPAPPNFPVSPLLYGTADDAIGLIVDIDLFAERSQNPWMVTDSDALWNYMNRLRVRKNEIFEGTITDETRSLIQ